MIEFKPPSCMVLKFVISASSYRKRVFTLVGVRNKGVTRKLVTSWPFELKCTLTGLYGFLLLISFKCEYIRSLKLFPVWPMYCIPQREQVRR